jgi:poly-gamma-glutamate synthesis protein (capsule biosynthesis protein)
VSGSVTLFLCGDVMLGRGIDQILPHPSAPIQYESCVKDARDYVRLAARRNGEITRPASFDYVWGEALPELQRRRPDIRIINLETSITRSDAHWPKGINYRMSPDNAPALVSARIDCCVLANNHLLDWGRDGLLETQQTLRRLDIESAGAGATLSGAEAPAILPLAGDSRVLVFAAATDDSGVPATWAAEASRSGVNRLPDLSGQVVKRIAADVRRHRREGDRVVFSVHWGGNWDYGVATAQRSFAHGLIDEAGVDVVYGHSSHHVKAIESYRGKLILYGCGDLLNDYEGITGHDEYRGDLGLMYFPKLERATGRLLELVMTPTRIRHLRIEGADAADRRWILDRLQRECSRFGGTVSARSDGAFALGWTGDGST